MEKKYDKTFAVDIDDEKSCEKLIKAIDCKSRRSILRLLSKGSMTIWKVAQTLNMPVSTVSEHVKVLIDSGLIRSFGQKLERGKSKILTRMYEKILINIYSDEKPSVTKSFTQQIPIGSYSDFNVGKCVGMLGSEGYIGLRDSITCMYSPIRFLAQLIWFDSGYLEYTVPADGVDASKILSVSVSAEICSEAPDYDESWKSDIFFELNGKELCVYNSPGDFGARRGNLTPEWWSGTQYGLIKCVEVTQQCTFLDGKPVSNVTLSDLDIQNHPVFTFRIGVRDDAKNKGGLNIFGKKFGDYAQHIVFTVTYGE